MNEATFEVHLASVLERLFPGPLVSQVETQRVFTLRLGHQTFEVNGLAFLFRGRADVILQVSQRPTLMLELKAPGVELTGEDVKQGLSYARLHEPMVPIVVVTNGTTTRLYSTFDGSPIEGETLDEQKLARLLETGARRAAWSREEAVRNLIGGDPTVWASALRAETNRQLEDLEGPVEDLTRPLSKGFRLPRRATAMLAGALVLEKEPALALVGPPLSGKTNVIAELCRRSEHFKIAPLYVDCMESSDLLEEIARALTDSLGATIPRDQVYDWLRLGIGGDEEDRPRLVLILDSLFPRDSAELMKQASQLLTIAGSNFSVLYSLTDGDWDRVRSVPGRMTLSKLGRHAKPVMLYELTDDEVQTARENFYASHRVLLPNSYQCDLTMRQPHSLRLLMSMGDFLHDVPEAIARQMPPIIPVGFLQALWDRTSQVPELRADYLSLARCYIKDTPSRQNNVHLAMIGLGVGAMAFETVQAELSEDTFARLLTQGHIKRVNLLESIVIMPTVPELLSAACVSLLLPMLLERNRLEDPRAAKGALLEWTRSLALGDCVAALILVSLATQDGSLFLDIVRLLMGEEPHEEIKESGDFLLQVPGAELIEMIYDGDSIRIKLPDGTEKEMAWPEDEGPMKLMTDLHPWNILSHLSYSGIAIGPEDAPALLASSIFLLVGKFRSTLRDVGRASHVHTNVIYEHTLPGYGSVPCPSRGIVEPITYSMQFNIQHYGDFMDEFVEEAIEDGDPALLMRLYVAATSLEGITNSDIASQADRVTKSLHEALDSVFKRIHQNGEHI
ncbi:MAG: hypothetical protein ACYCSN_07060 [Acidobacteriaceae bacterium]